MENDIGSSREMRFLRDVLRFFQTRIYPENAVTGMFNEEIVTNYDRLHGLLERTTYPYFHRFYPAEYISDLIAHHHNEDYMPADLRAELLELARERDHDINTNNQNNDLHHIMHIHIFH